MNLRTALKVIAALSALFGIGFAAVPSAVFAPYGVHLDASGTFVARLFGAANIGLAIAVWSAADEGAQTRRSLAWGVVGYSVVEGIVSAGAVLTGVANILGWGFVVLDVVFVAACLALMRPAAEGAPSTAVGSAAD